MIAAIVRACVAHRGMVLLAALLLTIAGLLNLRTMPVDAIPDLSDVQVIIRTPFAGQAPQVVEDQVTYPLTTAMLAVPGATHVRGYSFFGDSYVYILFADGTDPYWARSRVLESLSQVSASLPASVTPVLGPDATGVGWIYEYALVDSSNRHDLSQLRAIQDWFLKYELQTVPGVAEVASVGGMVKQYQVIVDPEYLSAHQLSLSQLRDAIRQGNSEAGGSVIEMAETEFMIRATGYIKGLDDLRAIPLTVNKHGTPVRLGDVATVQQGPQLRRGIAELNGEGEVAGGIIVMRIGENARATIAAVKQRLNELSASLPEGVEIVPTYDRSELIDSAIDNLNRKLVEEFSVVAIICALFLLHIRSSLVVMMTLPLGILSALLIMRMQGINANIMSLGGIAIAIGAMVDGAIVMIENVHKHLENKPAPTNEQRWQIIINASTEVASPLFFSLLIITLSFLPVFTLQAQEGRLFAPLAFTKTWAMATAAIISITLVPVLMGYLIRGRLQNEQRNPVNRLLTALYKPVIGIALNKPRTVIVISGLFIVSGLWPLSKLGTEFMPALDEGDWMYMPATSPGLSIGEASQLLQQTNRLIKSVPEVAQVFGKIGRADTATDPAPLTMIETIIRFKPPSQWRKGMSIDDIRAEIKQTVNLPGVSNAWVMPIKTRIDMLATGIKTPVGIKISGADLSVIQHIGQQIETLLPAVKGTDSVYAERVMGARYVVVDIDRDKAARFGMNIDDVHSIIRSAIGGVTIAETVEGLQRFPINLRYPRAMRSSLEAIQASPVITPTGARIRLDDIASIRIENGPPMIKSENARPAGWVYVDIADTDIGSYVNDARLYLQQHLPLPKGYTLTWSGQYEYMERAKETLLLVIPLTVFIIVLLLYFAFNRIADAVIVLATLPMAITGGAWLLWWLDYNLSVAVATGFIALAGVAVEVGVIMLIYLNQYKERYLQQTPNITSAGLRQAISHGALQRLRPIIMTMLTVTAGLVPIMAGHGTGSGLMQRIAAPMIGGMFSTLILALVVLPAVYFLYQHWQLNRDTQ